MSNKNELNLIFGPTMPPELESVGLAFIAAPYLEADTSIASLAADRYANENYGHLADDVLVFSEGVANKTLDLVTNIDPLTVGGRFSPTGLASYGPYRHTFQADDEEINLKILHTPIKVVGLNQTTGNNWYPLIQPGTVWRKYVVSSMDSATGWIKLSGAQEGDQLWLIYAVPEYRYGTEETISTTPFSSGFKYKLHQEVCSLIKANQIAYKGPIDLIKNIYINGSKQYSGDLNYTGATQHSYVKNLDPVLKTITLSKSLLPDDHILVEYLGRNDLYTYSGFRDSTNTWYSFDANCEYGHWIGNDQTRSLNNSANALLNQVTIYAIPSAYMKYSFEPAIPSTGTHVGKVTLKFVRACEHGETHFIRHIVSGERLEQLDSRITGTSVKSTWGHAVFGMNYYDEYGTFETDIFSRIVPTMLPLARVVLAAPASVNSVAYADTRIRGGGVPEDYPLEVVESQGQTDTVRGYWDMATWSGAALKEGGVVEVQIDSSILKTDPEDTNPETFTAEEIYEIVKASMLPSVDFRIVYTTV